MPAQRVAAVSGGSSGIGRAAALALARRGWCVALGARRDERVTDAAEAVRALGARAYGGRLDVADADSVEHFYAGAEGELGAVDLALCCAAHARPGRLHESSAEEIRGVIESGLTGALLFARRAVASMLAAGRGGDVVFVSSTSARVPWPWLAAYAASKAGVEQAARSLGLELEGTGVRVLLVRVGNTAGTGWAEDWGPERVPALEAWQHFGLVRHAGLLQPEQVAEALLAAVDAPRGAAYDELSVNPEAPRAGGG